MTEGSVRPLVKQVRAGMARVSTAHRTSFRRGAERDNEQLTAH
jgi:hypothetical protein